jgi:hypothetical protein
MAAQVAAAQRLALGTRIVRIGVGIRWQHAPP